jgi:DNA (cytosine-5)-methyltransferase 1
MTFGSLFAGRGGMDRGLEDAGMTCRWQVEINAENRVVLADQWPNAWRHDDVRTFPPDDGRDWSVDLIAGGFPCQDVSDAGLRAGIGGERSGLWFEFARVIRVLRPSLVLVENTTGLLDRGMGDVLWSLAAFGYDAEWSVLSACALGASHPRERVFIVAYPTGEREGQLRRIACKTESEARRDVPWPQSEPGIPRELDGVPGRDNRITAIGNAVCPPVAKYIGRRLMECAILSPPNPKEEST